MFAFAGAASFPTYQSDMKDRRDFPKAVLGAMISKTCQFSFTYFILYHLVLILIYLPMAATGYFQLGVLARDDGGIVCALCEGGVGWTVLKFLYASEYCRLNLLLKFYSSFTWYQPIQCS